jgi:hypothetical protein
MCAAVAGFAAMQIGWMIEEYIEDARTIAMMLMQSAGKFSKQSATGKGAWLADVFVTGAGFDDPYYLIDIEFSLLEQYQLQVALSQARIPVLITDTTNITVEFDGCESSVTFPASEAHTLHKTRVRQKARVYRVNAKIRIGSVTLNTYVDIPVQVWLELEQNLKYIRGAALLNRAAELYTKAKDELEALQRLWREWLDDQRPTCELAPEIQTRMTNYNTYATQWKQAHAEAMKFIYTELPELKPPKNTEGLPIVLPFEQWPQRTKLATTLESLASQAETIASSIAASVEDLKAKADVVLASIEKEAKDAVADILEMKRRGELTERIDARKAEAKARIAALKNAFTREAESTLRSIRTAKKQIEDIAARVKYLTCQGAKPQEYLIKPAAAGAGPAAGPAPTPPPASRRPGVIPT